MTDASLGMINPGHRPDDTALPPGIALGSSFKPALARKAGAMLGRKARGPVVVIFRRACLRLGRRW
jgi:beta-glucosidase